MPLILPYSFPKAVSEEPDISPSKEAQVSQNLLLERQWVKMSPEQSTEPYVKTFSNSNTPKSIIIPVEDPLDDILAESHQEMGRYTMVLPDTKTPELAKLHSKPSHSLLLNRKRSRNILEPISQRQLDSSNNASVYSGTSKSPTRHSVRVLSSTLKKPNLREPTSERESTKKSSNSEKLEVDDANKSMGDPLACHADNIMRMAMDSTMLGSFYNNSFSSTFSNLADDSVLGRKYPDILGESDRSLTDHRAPPPMLARLRAQKIDISAADLQEAVNGEIR